MRRCTNFAPQLVLGLTLASIGLTSAACESPAPSHAEMQNPQPVPRLVRQSDGSDRLQIAGGQVPGMTTVEVSQVELPGVLEASGQVDFDDRRVATVASFVAGRIEETRVSQWYTVRGGEPIV